MRRLILGVLIMTNLFMMGCGTNNSASASENENTEVVENIEDHEHYKEEHQSCEVLLNSWKEITNIHNELLEQYETDKSNVEYGKAIDKYDEQINILNEELSKGIIAEKLVDMYKAYITNIEGFQESYRLMNDGEVKKGQKLGKKIIKNFQNNSEIFQGFHRDLT